VPDDDCLIAIKDLESPHPLLKGLYCGWESRANARGQLLVRLVVHFQVAGVELSGPFLLHPSRKKVTMKKNYNSPVGITAFPRENFGPKKTWILCY
jgi:hypothetical protein